MKEQLCSDAMHRPGAVKETDSLILIAKACNKDFYYSSQLFRKGGGRNG